MLSGELANFPNVVVALLLTDTSETQGGLTTATVLLRQLHLHALKDFLAVALESGVEHTVTVHNDEAELLVVFEESGEWRRLERVLAAVGESSDWLERLQIDCYLLFGLAVAEFNHTAEEHQAIWWH